MKTLTNSQRSSFFRCPKKWQYENILCRKPIETSDALAFGTAFHKWLEHWSLHEDKEAKEFLNSALDNAFKRAKLRAMCKAYVDYWRENGESIYDTKPEVKFSVPILANVRNSAWTYSGKIDSVVKTEEGTFIMEHKTTGNTNNIEPGSDYWQRLEIDGQIEGYMFGYIKSTGEVPMGVIYDVARKPGIKPLRQDKENAETPIEYEKRCYETIMKEPSKYLARAKIYKTNEKLAEFEKDVYQTARMIDECRNNDYFPRSSSGCKVFGTCPYFDVCAGNAEITDNSRFIDTTPNPELQEAS
jgi:hypothetical protein